jgi:hypothetical protein
MARATIHATAANRKLFLAFFTLSFLGTVSAQVPEQARHEIDRIMGANGVFVSEEGV